MITGAAGGIGRAVARALAAEGMHLALVDIDEARLARVAATLDTRCTTHVTDVADRAAVDRLVDDVLAAHGAVHLLVNNAGVSVHGPFVHQEPDDLEWIVGINLLGVLHLAHAFLPHLRRTGDAHVVNVSSMAALAGAPLQTTYSATKAAVRVFSEGLRVELSGDGVGVTAVLPGNIATPFLARARSRHRSSTWMADAMQRRGLAPERVARAILRAVRRDRAEVLVGLDSRVAALVRRACPGLLRVAFTLGWARVRPDREPPDDAR